jgi:hypothetical protein
MTGTDHVFPKTGTDHVFRPRGFPDAEKRGLSLFLLKLVSMPMEKE